MCACPLLPVVGLMADERKTKEELLEELAELRRRLDGLLEAEAKHTLAQETLFAKVETMERTLHGAVSALAAMAECRNPNLAGHHARVTTLACAIAREMSLPDARIDGLRAAARLHDLGTIAVPAEILTKPSKLTETETLLTRTHVQTGYDILKTIDFPWPVAEIVLQHHERMDSSGYPQGLCGDDILLEARILAVADVVEVMASHQPSRQALGIEKALEEISLNKGVLFDSAAVDACLKLFAGGQTDLGNPRGEAAGPHP